MIVQSILRAYNDRGEVLSEAAFPASEMQNVQLYLDAFVGRLIAHERPIVRVMVDLALTPDEAARGVYIGVMEAVPSHASHPN